MPDTDTNTEKKQNSFRPNVSSREIDEAKRELKQAIKGSHEILYTADTVFPFTLFPDTVTIDRAKLTIIRRKFFGLSDSMSIRIEDLLNVTANTGPFFGSISLNSRVFNPHKPYVVNFLWREDTIKIKRIVQGYVIAMQKDIDLTPLTTDELSKMLNDLGKDDHDQ